MQTAVASRICTWPSSTLCWSSTALYSVWDPRQQKYIQMLEGVQSFAARVATRQWSADPNQTRLATTLCQTLVSEDIHVPKDPVWWELHHSILDLHPTRIAHLICKQVNCQQRMEWNLWRTFRMNNEFFSLKDTCSCLILSPNRGHLWIRDNFSGPSSLGSSTVCTKSEHRDIICSWMAF